MKMGVIIVVFLLVALGFLLLAWFSERVSKKKNGDTERILTTRKVVVTGMFSAIAALLMLVELPVFFAPGFYKIDLSELPPLICGFAFGPVAGVMTELIKIILKVVIKGTSTAMVGELANFVVGCCMVLPASLVYSFGKSKSRARMACILGTLCMSVAGSLMNAFFLIPAFAAMFGMPVDAIIEMGTALNPGITNIWTFVLFAVVPLNIIKGTLVSIVTLLVYKKVSPVMKRSGVTAKA